MFLVQSSSAAVTLRDGCWLYGHDSGDHDGLGDNPMNGYNVPLSPPLAIGDAARSFGLPNVCVCRWGHADDAYLRQFAGLRRVSWAITGERDDRYYNLVSHDFRLLGKMPNLVAFDLDDFFRPQGSRPDDVIETPHGPARSAAGAIPYDELLRLRSRAHEDPKRPVELQLVVYDFELREEMRPVFEAVDRVQYWTWCGQDLSGLEDRFRLYRKLAPDKPTTLGVYMWDFGNRRPLELAFMKAQLETGYRLWKRGEVEGFVFHCSNLLNKNLPAVEYARAWFAAHADETRETARTHPVADPQAETSGDGWVSVRDLGVTAEAMRARRAQLDAAGKGNVRLLVGGDEWMPFHGQGERQLLCAGKDRVLIVEPSGRVAWKREGCGPVSDVRLKDGFVWFSGPSLRRVKYALPCDPAAPAETVYPSAVVGFDFVPRADGNGFDVALLPAGGSEVVLVDPARSAVVRRFSVPVGAKAVRSAVKGELTVVCDGTVRRYATDGKLIETRVPGGAVNDAVLLDNGNLLVVRDDSVVEYCACGNERGRFDRPADPEFANARFASVQRVAGQTVVGVVGADGQCPTALGIASDWKVIWRCASSADRGMPCVRLLRSEVEYN